MADPPVASTPSTKDEGGEVGEEQIEEEEFLVVKDGYFRYIDILFEWCKYMNPWQVCLLYQQQDPCVSSEKADEQKNAVKALLNGEALTHPDHPLHQAGQDGIELYISKLYASRETSS
jgi:hypothetical protein